MSEDQPTLLTPDLRPVPDLLRSGAIFEHVQRSPTTFPTMPLRCRSLPLNLRSLPFNSRSFPMGPDFQIGLDRERVVAQWNGGIKNMHLLNYVSILCEIDWDCENNDCATLCLLMNGNIWISNSDTNLSRILRAIEHWMRLVHNGWITYNHYISCGQVFETVCRYTIRSN